MENCGEQESKKGWEPVYGMTLDEAYYDIMEKISLKEWCHFARALGLKDFEIDSLKVDFQNDVKEQMYRACKIWERKKGQFATKEHLYSILNYFLNPEIHPKPVESDENRAENYCARASKYVSAPTQNKALLLKSYEQKHLKGKVIIINNTFKQLTQEAHRPVAEMDEKNMINLWRGVLNSDVMVHRDITAIKLRKKLEKFSATISNCDYCVVIVMSHGGENDKIYGNSYEPDDYITAHEIVNIFDIDQSPHLEGIPKMFFFQCSRGEKVSAKHDQPRVLSAGDETKPISKQIDRRDDKRLSEDSAYRNNDEMLRPLIKSPRTSKLSKLNRNSENQSYVFGSIKHSESSGIKKDPSPDSFPNSDRMSKDPSSSSFSDSHGMNKDQSPSDILNSDEPIEVQSTSSAISEIDVSDKNPNNKVDAARHETTQHFAFLLTEMSEVVTNKEEEMKQMEVRHVPSEIKLLKSETLPKFSDMLISYSTAPGHDSFHDPQNGSWFINAITNIFTEHSRREHVIDLMVKVNEAMAEKRGIYFGFTGKSTIKMTSHFECTLRKHLYLQKNPNDEQDNILCNATKQNNPDAEMSYDQSRTLNVNLLLILLSMNFVPLLHFVFNN